MDCYDEVDAVTVENAMAVRRRNYRMSQMAFIFRCVEALVAVVSLVWLSSRLPLAFFSHLAAILVTPRFVFFISNTIIVTLVVKLGRLNAQTSLPENFPTSDIYDGLLRNDEGQASKAKEVDEKEEVICLDKTVCVENPHEGKDSTLSMDSQLTLVADQKREYYRRTTSDMMVAYRKKAKLRRYDSDNSCQRLEESGPTRSNSESDMSNEEFRMAIEAFIARQLKFQKEESMAIVPHGRIILPEI